MNSVHADGGWALALTLTILFVAFAFITVRKRWPSMMRKPSLALSGGSSADDSKQKPAKEPEKKGQGSGHGTKRSPILLYLLIGVIAIVIVINIIPITGWVVDTFLHEVLGDKIVTPQQYARTHAGPLAMATRYTNELPCPPWDRKRHVCLLTGTTVITQAPGLPAGLTFCITPGPDTSTADTKDRKWKSIRAILSSGDTVDLDPEHPLTNLTGYELTPAHGRLPVVYWFSHSPSCT